MINPKKDWEKIIFYIEEIRPLYGVINIELTFHQKGIKKVKILQKEEVIILNKKEGEDYEKI